MTKSIYKIEKQRKKRKKYILKPRCIWTCVHVDDRSIDVPMHTFWLKLLGITN